MDSNETTLKNMQICRFCLDEGGPFFNIYEKDIGDGKRSVPLPLQIMACLSIEVYQNDGMPQVICHQCKGRTVGAYNFKNICKKADDALKLYIATGNLNALQNSKIKHVKQSNQIPAQKEKQTSQLQSSLAQVQDKIKSEEGNVQVHEEHEPDVQMLQQNIEFIDVYEDSMENESQQGSQEEQDQEQEQVAEEEDDEEEGVPSNVPHVETDVFSCNECERSFPLKQLLELHMKNHNRERCFSCEDCGRKFFTKYDLAKHLQTHLDNKPYTCVICMKQFSRESLLHRHEKIHTDAPKYLCTQCDKTFLKREDLVLHAEKHRKTRPFTCRICKKGFVFKQGLERHEMTHTDEKPHKCNYCEASFTSPIKLMRHITSHAGLRPYPCKMCGRTFLLSHHLTRHMRTHYATKSPIVEPVGQHKCDVCSMSFRRKDSLINHSAIHSMVNLKCVICNTAFQNAKQVKEHITTHLAGLPYPCDKCDYSFETQDQLEEHELKHAEMEYEDQIEQELTQEAQAQEQGQYEEEDEGDDDVVEFTITNDNEDNPQVVPRPKRHKSNRNYTQFLRDELGSDVEDELILEDQHSQQGQEEELKPIVRSEGTKMYGRKNEKRVLPDVKLEEPKIDENPNINLDQIGFQDVVKDLPNKQYVDMKIGAKTVRVQKLMMTKAEIEEMAKQGKIEVKGDNIILKKQVKAPNRNASTQNVSVEPKSLNQRTIVTRTYNVRKNQQAAERKTEES